LKFGLFSAHFGIDDDDCKVKGSYLQGI